MSGPQSESDKLDLNKVIEEYTQGKLDFSDSLMTLRNTLVGILILSFPEMMTRNGGKTYAPILHWMPYWGWGSVLILIGVVRYMATKFRNIQLRSFGAYWGAAYWLLLSWDLYKQIGMTIAGAMIFTSALIDIIIYVRRTDVHLRRKED